MMKSLMMISAITLSLTSFVSAQTACTSTFAKTIGSALASESGYSLAVDDTHKVLYVGASVDDSTMILKLDAEGNILWARTLDVISGQIERVIAIVLDSDGMLCLGGMTDDAGGGKAYLFRYNPDLHQVLWAKEYQYDGLAYVFGLIEKEPGGNYLMSNNPLTPNNAELIEIDRNTGQINPAFAKHYDLGSSETIWGMVTHGDGLYVTGRYTDGGTSADMRTVLSKLDADTGVPVWTKLGHRPGNVDARLYGTDLIIDQEAIYSLSTGDPAGTDLTKSQMWIHKTTLDGDVLWTRNYALPGTDDVSEEIISTGDGFVIMGRNAGPNDIFLFKINREGDVQWAKIFDFPGAEATFPTGGTFSQLVSMDSALYFTAWTALNGRRDMILVKTDWEGRIDDNCNVARSIDISVSNFVEGGFYAVEPEVFDFVPDVEALEIHPSLTSLETENTCINPGNTETTIEASVCSGDAYEGYTQAGTYRDTFAVEGGCDSIRILNLRLITCDPLVVYNLNACSSYMTDGSNMDYSEFVPAYPANDACASVSASTLHRSPPQENKHSCTPGLNNSSAMCVSAMDGCTWVPGHQASVVIEVTVTPEANAISEITGLKFYEKAPTTYNWIDGGNGPNNYPTLFGIRILKDGTVIYSDPAIPTATGWTLHEISFIGNSLFEINQATVLRIELLPYCPVGNGAAVAAWDLEDVVLSGGCVILPASEASLAGNVVNVKGNPLSGAEIQLSRYGSFAIYEASETSHDGEYQFAGLETGAAYFARGYYLDDFLHGVSTLDLITMQKHLLGKVPFTSLDQFVAADINHDGEVNISDVIMLRMTLLGYTNDFPGNTSWRFGVLPQTMEGTDPSRFDELLYLETIQSGETSADFLGIKIGDLNKTITGRASGEPIAKRTDDALSISVEDIKMGPGSQFTMTIKSGEDITTDGLQLGWRFDGMTLSDIQGVVLPVTEDNISFQHDGVFRLSWNGTAPVSIHKGDVLFTLTLTPSIAESLSGNIRQADEVLQNEIYTDQKATPVRLDIKSSPSVDVPVLGYMNVTPNPFTDETVVSYTIAKDGIVRINMFDASGRLLYTTSREETFGEHAVQISAGDLGHYVGMMFCQIICGGDVKVRKVVRGNDR